MTRRKTVKAHFATGTTNTAKLIIRAKFLMKNYNEIWNHGDRISRCKIIKYAT